MFDTIRMYYEYIVRRQKFPNIIFWPKTILLQQHFRSRNKSNDLSRNLNFLAWKQQSQSTIAQIENAEMSDMDDERCLALDMF